MKFNREKMLLINSFVLMTGQSKQAGGEDGSKAFIKRMNEVIHQVEESIVGFFRGLRQRLGINGKSPAQESPAESSH